MISIICFIIVIFGSLNWLSIGFFQYDLVAGLFGFQGSIFSRIVYIIVGISAIYLTFTVIKHKGRISVKRLKKEEAPIIDKMKSDEETNSGNNDNTQTETTNNNGATNASQNNLQNSNQTPTKNNDNITNTNQTTATNSNTTDNLQNDSVNSNQTPNNTNA